MDIREYSVADYHVHPDFSFDAEGSIDDYCQMALAQGLTEICFTTHYDINPILSEKERSMRIDGQLVPHSIENFGKYYTVVEKAHRQYYRFGLSVKAGAEIGYFPGCEDEIGRLIKIYPLDHLIGSIHEVEECCICYGESVKAYSERVGLDDFISRYFELMKKMVESRLFDVVGHLDRYRTYGKKYYGDKILQAHSGHIETIFEAMIKNGVGYEINTLAVHYHEPDYYPSMDIVNLARKMGVKLVTIGSDAHCPEDLGRDFEMAISVAYELFPYRGE
ncbi:MAG: histidinol-phosphatase [Candidatus Zixiibacteriota bacterium]